jgi:diacylglycerol kinase family enzyme
VVDLDIRLTTAGIGADQLAQEAVAEGVSMIIASGGYGTLSAAVVALVETKIPLGIISRGTANALANTLGISNTLEAACKTILHGYTRVTSESAVW